MSIAASDMFAQQQPAEHDKQHNASTDILKQRHDRYSAPLIMLQRQQLCLVSTMTPVRVCVESICVETSSENTSLCSMTIEKDPDALYRVPMLYDHKNAIPVPDIMIAVR